MNLLQSTKEQLNWLISLGRKVLKLTHGEATFSVLLFLLSQLFLVLALFLPLKAILLLATEGVPWYLLGVVSAENKDYFVFFIALAAIVSYGLHHSCEWVLGKTVRKGSRRILESSKKLTLFDNQADFAREGYIRLIRATGAGILVGLGFVLGAYLNPVLFIALAGLVVVEYFFLHFFLKSTSSLGQTVGEFFATKFNVACNVLSSTNFLIGFFLLFVQFLVAEERNVILAIVNILLIRQVMLRISVGVQDLIFLANNRLRLNALFYTSIQYVPIADRQHDAFLATLAVPGRDRWLASVFTQVLKRSVEGIESKWTDGGVPGLAYLEVSVTFEKTKLKKDVGENYFVKYFDKRKSRLAEHEIKLFTAMPSGFLGMPKFYGTISFENNQVLIFEGLPQRSPEHRQWKQLYSKALFQLWALSPSEELIHTYLRTHPTITSRLKPQIFVHMEVAVHDHAERECLKQFIETWPAIRERVNRLPLVIKNPGFNFQTCRLGPNDTPFMTTWHNWMIEPIGCDALLVNQENASIEKHLKKYFGEVSLSFRPTASDVVLVSRLFQLEIALKQNSLRQALIIIMEILEVVQSEDSCQEVS